jgi:glycosyltransferase involved in cell wall biosynthesis
MNIIADRNPLISIIIDTYNYGHFIEEAIESVLNQTFPHKDFELIVVDDGSTDDTSKVIKKYKDKIKYIFKENGGQASAFNVGFENAAGKIIALLDADDYWHPDKLKYIAEEFEKSTTVDVASHYMHLVDNDHKMVGIFPDPSREGKFPFEKQPLQSYLRGIFPFFPPTSGITVRADCLRKIIPIPVDFRIAADFYMHLMLPFHAREFALIRKYLGSYRIHDNNFGIYWIFTNRHILGKSEPDTIDRVIQVSNMNILASKHVERAAKELGYSFDLWKKKFEALRIEQEVLLYNLRGKKLRAIQQAFMFDDPTFSNMLCFRSFRKASLIMSVIIPYPMYLWLRRKYRNCFLFDIMHDFFEMT